MSNLERTLIYKGIGVLHLSGAGTLALILGLFITVSLLKRTKKVQHFFYGVAVTILFVSIVTYHFVPDTYLQYKPEWIVPQVAIPVAIMIAAIGFLIGFIRKGSRYVLRAVVGVTITTLLSGGYAFSFLNPSSLGSFSRYIPFIQSTTQEAKNKAYNAVDAVQAEFVSANDLSSSMGQNKASGVYGKITDKSPNKLLAESVLTENVKKQLGTAITWNNTGAFLISNNKTNLNAKITSAPYANNSKVDRQGRLGVANAWLNKSSRQYENRSSNGNDRKIDPAGYKQMKLSNGVYLYNRGHLLGYAIVGNIKGFDASEANKNNIATQTEWANQAMSAKDTGQNYYEGLVRKALDQNKQVRYRVTPIYDNGIIPVGNHLEAKSKDNSLEFNVFVPNVEAGVLIDYKTGVATTE